MTTEKAIRVLSSAINITALAGYEDYDGFIRGKANLVEVNDACELAIAALRAQQLDRSRWEGCFHCKLINEKKLKYGSQYCPNCGRPLTEKAWAEMERRIGGVQRGEG